MWESQVSPRLASGLGVKHQLTYHRLAVYCRRGNRQVSHMMLTAGMGIHHRKKFCSSDSAWGGVVCGENSVLNTHAAFRARSCMAVTRLSHFNCERSCWLLPLQAGISAECSQSCVLLRHVSTKVKSGC